MTSVIADDGSSNVKKADELDFVWFFSIDMDFVAKRPYSPSIELATHPAKKVKLGKKKETKMTAPTLSVIFRTKYNLDYYMVEGIRLPDGVDRKALQCYWRSSDQQLVVWAPCTKETTANDVIGVSIRYNDSWIERKEMDIVEQIKNSQTRVDHNSHYHQLKIRLANIPFMGASHQNTVTFHNCRIGTRPFAVVSQILESKAAEKLRSNELKASRKLEKKMKKEKELTIGGEYERQYWFRNPVINFNHYEDNEKEDEEEEKDDDDEKENIEEEEEDDDEEEEEEDDEEEKDDDEEEEEEDDEEEKDDDEEEKDSDESEEEDTDDEEEKESDSDEVDGKDEDDDEEDE